MTLEAWLLFGLLAATTACNAWLLRALGRSQDDVRQLGASVGDLARVVESLPASSTIRDLVAIVLRARPDLTPTPKDPR